MELPCRTNSDERFRDERVELRRVREGLLHQVELELQRRSARTRHLLEDPGIVRRIDDDHDVAEVLPRRAQQRRAPDVDLLDELVKRRLRVLRGLRERIQVHDHQIDQLHALRLDRRQVIGTMAPGEDPAVDFRVQRLDPAVHHLGKPGDVGHVGHRQAGIGQDLGRAAGRHELDAAGAQPSGEVDEAGLVRDAQNCAHIGSCS